MLRDPSYSDMIAWFVPSHNELTSWAVAFAASARSSCTSLMPSKSLCSEGTIAIPSTPASNGSSTISDSRSVCTAGRRGKLSPCSYIHDSLIDGVGSLFTLETPPAKKRASDDMDSASVERLEHGRVERLQY
ncbi:hypothetical protein ACHAW5_008851 [Stephanodiscus triporus]|uniref:Uncharacterized protein n=1 Tax=Stephanodiscus triporus TaxID=2934178 RepID=A0ABD3NF31_9STRA